MKTSRNAAAWVGVYEVLRDRIINGTYSPGEKLGEREIAELVHVSRTPTREALRVLEYEGFVIKSGQGGIYVKKYSPEELDTLHKMLIRLEGLAVQMAIPKLSDSDLTNLQNLTDRMSYMASKRRYGDYLGLNFDFHLLFPKITESKELIDTTSQLRKKIFRFYYSHIILANDPENYINDHQEIIDALRGKTAKKPEKLMENHVDRARRSFLEFYRKFR